MENNHSPITMSQEAMRVKEIASLSMTTLRIPMTTTAMTANRKNRRRRRKRSRRNKRRRRRKIKEEIVMTV